MTSPTLSAPLAQRLRALPGDLRCRILGMRHQVEIVAANKRDKRPEHWYHEQEEAIRSIELAERIATAVARDPARFIEWAGLSA